MIFEILALGTIAFVVIKGKDRIKSQEMARRAKAVFDVAAINSPVYLNNIKGVQSSHMSQTGANSEVVLLQDPLSLRKSKITNVGRKTDQIYSLIRNRLASAQQGSVGTFENQVLSGKDLGQTTFIDGSVTTYRLPYDFPVAVLGGNRMIKRG